MGFRWYGEDNDKISLADIKQIPGVTSIVWALHHKLPGEVWTVEEIAEVQKQLEPYGFNMDVVESVNVHDDIKIGLPSRDQYIENYIQTIKNLSKFGVKVICYNFMPIFDWTRTDLFHPVGDGSTALYYEAGKIHDDPKEMADYILNKSTVSRFHVRITEEDGQYFLTDLNSTNGTKVNGRLLAANEKVVLSQGDEVWIAEEKYLWR